MVDNKLTWKGFMQESTGNQDKQKYLIKFVFKD